MCGNRRREGQRQRRPLTNWSEAKRSRGTQCGGERTADAAVADTLGKFNYGVENIHDVNGAEGSRTRELMRSSDELALWWHNQIMALAYPF